MNLLPAIDILGGQAVRLAQGDYQRVTVYNDDPVAQARDFAAQGARWVHVVDLDGARDGEPKNAEVIIRIIKESGLKVEVGGGMRTLDAVARYADAGAARIVMGSALVNDPTVAKEAAKRFGAKVAAGIDARDGMVAVEGWREGTKVAAADLVARLADMGIRHLVYTDIARDGMQTGIDVGAYVRIAESAEVAVTASGGISTLGDLRALVTAADGVRGMGRIEGAITGRAIYEGAFTVRQALDVITVAQDEAWQGAWDNISEPDDARTSEGW